MRKKLSAIILAASILTMPPILAKAESGTWFMNATNTKLEGTLYAYDDVELANAKTTNLSENNYRVVVKLYASAGGTTIDSSWKESRGYPYAWVKSAARSPQWWGSGHSTTPTSDDYKWLTLYVGK